MFVQDRNGDYRSLNDVKIIGVEHQVITPAIDRPGGEFYSVYLERMEQGILPTREYVGPEYAALDDARAAAKLLADAVGIVELPED